MSCFFFFKDTAPTEIYTLSLHDALPICKAAGRSRRRTHRRKRATVDRLRSSSWLGTPRDLANSRTGRPIEDRKSTRLNSSHSQISYAVFCLKKKKIKKKHNSK